MGKLIRLKILKMYTKKILCLLAFICFLFNVNMFCSFWDNDVLKFHGLQFIIKIVKVHLWWCVGCWGITFDVGLFGKNHRMEGTPHTSPPHPQWETLPGGIPDEFSAMLIECVLKISVNFKLSWMIFPLFSMVIYIFAGKKTFVWQKIFDNIPKWLTND